jgi:hypothetical protein
MAIISCIIPGPTVFVPLKPFQLCPMFAYKLVANPIGGKCTSLTGWLLTLGAIIILGWKFFTRTKRASLFGSFVSVKEKRLQH